MRERLMWTSGKVCVRACVRACVVVVCGGCPLLWIPCDLFGDWGSVQACLSICLSVCLCTYWHIVRTLAHLSTLPQNERRLGLLCGS